MQSAKLSRSCHFSFMFQLCPSNRNKITHYIIYENHSKINARMANSKINARMANSMMYENLLSRFALLEHRYLSCILSRWEERYVLFECKNITFIIHLLITLLRIIYIISNYSFHLHNSEHSLIPLTCNKSTRIRILNSRFALEHRYRYDHLLRWKCHSTGYL